MFQDLACPENFLLLFLLIRVISRGRNIPEREFGRDAQDKRLREFPVSLMCVFQTRFGKIQKSAALKYPMSLKDILFRYKPGVSIRTHLFLGGLIWTVVGVFLMANGFVLAYMADDIFYGVAGLLLGTVKTFLVLDRVARKNIKRIREFDDKVCFGSVYSWKTWFLVAAMIGLGRYLRTTVLPGQVIGLIYTAVGWGLLLASRQMWSAWRSTSK